MNWRCRWFGHDAGSRQMDADFHEYSRCRRCGVPLERGEDGKWKQAEAPLSPSPPPPD